MFDAILDAIFGPIASLPPLLAVAIFSLIVTTMTTFIYKAVTDQNKLKEIKGKIKEYQKSMKELNKEDPQKALSVQKKAMEKNMEYMKHSMKATLFTMLPIIIILGWLNANMAFYPINPAEEFTVYAELKEDAEGTVELDITPENQVELLTPKNAQIEEGKAEWKLKGPKGSYILSYNKDGNSYEQKLVISDEREYGEPNKDIGEGNFISGNIVHEKIMPLEFIGLKWGWLGSYIIFSIIIGMTLRKAMGLS